MGLSVAAGSVVGALLYTAVASRRAVGALVEALEVLDATVGGKSPSGGGGETPPSGDAGEKSASGAEAVDELLRGLGEVGAARAHGDMHFPYAARATRRSLRHAQRERSTPAAR